MRGIPHHIETKRDVENLQYLALANKINRNEWIKRLEKIKEDTEFKLPILEKTAEYIVTIDTDRDLSFIGDTEVIETEVDGQIRRTIKITVSNYQYNEIIITTSNEQLTKLELTKEEVENMIEELR